MCYNFILQALFQSAQHLYEKREGSGAGAGSIPLPNGSGSGSGSPTLKKTVGFPSLLLKDSGWTPDAARRSDLCGILTRPRHFGLSQGGTPLQVRGQVISAADPGCLIPDPNFSIPDPGSKRFLNRDADPHKRF